jgi:outer membrane murein-binding lipoprotein Lpp
MGVVPAVNVFLSDASGALHALSGQLSSWPGASILLLGVLALFLFATTVLVTGRMRQISEEVNELAHAVRDQTRSFDSLRRNLEAAIEDAATRTEGPSWNDRSSTSTASAALIREELESLRAEILSHDQQSTIPE